MLRLLSVLVLLGLGCSSEPPLSPDAPEVLVFSRTTEFRHDSIEPGIEALTARGRGLGIRVVATEDPARFNEAELARYRAVVFLNTTGDVLDDEQQWAFERYVQAGGGYVGIHSAADTEWRGNLWPWYTRLVGAAFLAHPSVPSNVQEARLHVVHDGHPATAGLDATWTHSDEYYDFKRFNPNVTTLLTVDEDTYQGGKTGDSHAISWFHEFDGGRSFYTGLGHTAESFADDGFLNHLFGGLRWAMGEGVGPPKLDHSASRPEDWRLVSEVLVDGVGEPMGMAFAEGGDLYVIERAGALHRLNAVAGTLELVARFPAYIESENGLAGIVFDPDYETNGWVYLYWASDPGGEQRPFYRLARYELRDGTLDLESERILLTVPIDRGMTSHEGGSLQFDDDGNLWISTGDDTNPHLVDGYAPLDARPGRRIHDASRSAPNSQDLRGKILRIHPEADGTYTIPEGNLFSDAADGRLEIYAMGLRNPFRLSVDSKNGVLYWGEVGPDAHEDSETRGPRGYDEVNRTTEPGNFGWPYAIGPNLPYASYDFEKKEAGAFFDPMSPTNDSARNTGARQLPPARPAWIAYSYDAAGVFYDLESGSSESSRTIMVGPVFHHADFEDQAGKLPPYYDGKLFVYEFMRDWIKLVSMDADGTIRKIEPFPTELALVAPIDVKLGPDGALYVLEYGSTWFQSNEDSRLSRISYFAGDNPLPSARASVTPTLGAAPLAVKLDGSASYDRNPDDELRYDWFLRREDGTETRLGEERVADVAIETPGRHEVRLRVTDTGGGTSSAVVPVLVGNEPPEVELDVAGNQSFFFEADGGFAYAVSASDAEDGSTGEGGIAPETVRVSVDYLPEGMAHGARARETRVAVGSLDPAVEAIDEYGCLSCHQPDAASAGPSFERIAEKYAGDPEMLRPLARKVITGGGGVWGDRAMAAQPHITDEAALQMVNYILNGPAGGVGSRPLRDRVELDRHVADAVDSDYFGRVIPGAYVIRAMYTDRGAAGSDSITRQETRVLRPPRLPLADADHLEGAQPVEMRPESVPEMIRDYMPAVPEGLKFLLARDGGHASFEAVDLTGIDRVEVSGSAISMFMPGGRVEVRLDTVDGPLLGVVEIPAALVPEVSAGEVAIEPVEGLRDVYFTFRGDGEGDTLLFSLAMVEFKRADGGAVGLRDMSD